MLNLSASLEGYRTLKRKYLWGFLAILLFATASQAVLQFMLKKQDSSASVVNLMGRQRMLSQELSSLYSHTLLEFTETRSHSQLIRANEKLANVFDELRYMHSALMESSLGSSVPEKVLIQFTHELKALERSLLHLDSLLSCSGTCIPNLATARDIHETVNDYRAHVDLLVFAAADSYRSDLGHLSILSFVLFGLLAIVLGFEFFGVLMPHLRKMEEENLKLQHTSKLASLGQMSASIVHEMGSPLTLIQQGVRTLKRVKDAPHSVFEVADRLERSTSKVVKLINGMRKFSRKGESDAHSIVSSLAIAEECLLMAEIRARTKNVIIKTGKIPVVSFSCDPGEIEQVLVNLLNNAIDAAVECENAWVQLDCRLDGTQVHWRVSDSGNGISLKDQQKIFQPFFSTKDAVSGTGLGLSIARNIALRHGGDIHYSRENGQTAFELVLPMSGSLNQDLPTAA
jgi:signal transduction histidine kinase